MTALAHRLLKLTLCIAFAVALAGTRLGDAFVRAADVPAKPAAADVPKGQGLTKQTDLFADPVGHAKPPLAVLVGYCYYAQIYGRSPVGLPVPPALKGLPDEEVTAKLNRLLQEIAWNTVTAHPLSGVKAK